jgi:hypothetical protein
MMSSICIQTLNASSVWKDLSCGILQQTQGVDRCSSGAHGKDYRSLIGEGYHE